ncbi:hypothetical protein AMATHDRAFT_58608 [Amanita thiersii Skay4041]|uniref:Peroxidase n=1 Tax=Amanita thiersii Skay4041 TaxID=703135 RepID=A0A2A9NVP1_9AGAR|nr:hypothetical protein AMATHDRAFT_58608 [Amanita thiersii Skay4041]
MRRHAQFALLFASSITPHALSYKWPSPQYEALEGYLYEGRRSDGSNLAAIVHPCRKRQGTLSSIPAEWLRFAFHDMSTYDASNGTGGLDSSITYELNRPENFGLGFVNTQSDFENFPNKYVSRSDVIALGAIMAVATCGGPTIPFRGGRVDALTAGVFGTPEPQQDLQTHTQMFSRAGFSQTEMIQMVACGHTLGGVRSADKPEIVPPGPDPTVTTIVDFDTTMQFDNKVVTEYLSGTTHNPLVVTPNVTLQSDSRIFSSDNNSTMQSLSSSDTFASTCKSIFERMLNTVPSGVRLTDEIQLIPAKVHDIQLTVERNNLVLKTSLRLTQPIDGPVNTKRTVTMFFCDRYGSKANCNGGSKSAQPARTVKEDPNLSPVTFNLGKYFINYNFVVPIDPTTSISKFWFEVDEKDGSKPTVYDNERDDYVVDQDQLIFVPTLGSTDYRLNPTRRGGGPVGGSNQTFTRTYTLVAGVRQESNPSTVTMSVFDSAIRGYPAPLNQTIPLTLNSSLSPAGGYKFYSARVESVGLQLTADFVAVVDGKQYGLDFQSTTFLDNTPYVPTTNVTNTSNTPTTNHSAALRPSPTGATLLVIAFASIVRLALDIFS